MSTQRLLSPRREAEGHEGTEVRRVRFEDRRELHAGLTELVGDARQGALARRRQDDSVRAFVDASIDALAGRMHDLGGLNAARQVRADDDVVKEGIGRWLAGARGLRLEG